MNVIVRNIPNSITCINVIAGVCAILALTRSGDPTQFWQPWMTAAICIGIAAVADFFDGFAARLLKAYSNMGKELDSLCDMVSFGVAPAVMVYKCMSSSPATAGIAGIAVLIAVGGALRLARFNVDDRQTVNFIGLPIPANAIFWIGFVAMLGDDAGKIGAIPMAAVIVFVSWLMVSPLPLVSLKFKSPGWRGNEKRWLTIILFIAAVAIFGVAGLMWGIVAYVLLSCIPIRQGN